MAFPTYKPAQTLALRHLNRKMDSNLKKQQNSRFSKEFKESARQLIMEFGGKSTIHGVNRIFQEHSNKYERFFWLCTLISALLGCIYVCLILSQRFSAGSLQTIVDSTNSPVFEIHFPEISICNANHLNWQRLEDAKNHFMPHENNTERIRMFELVIGLYDSLTFGGFNEFNALEGQPYHLVNDINFTLVFEFMTWRCEEFFTDCIWRHYDVNCCDIFTRSRGQNGLCWHFNTLSTKESRNRQKSDSKYPWRTGSAGPRSGLNVRILVNEDKHFRKDNEKGILITVMEPQVFHREPYWVPANTETMIEVEPVAYFYDNDTRSLTSEERKCVFNDEHNSHDFKTLTGFSYMIENCQAQCRQEYLLNYCNCTMDLMFPADNYKACQVKDLPCLAKNNDLFRFTSQFGEEEYVRNHFQGMVCKCFRNCYSLNYITDVRPSFLPAFLRNNKTYVDLDVHYRFESMILYRTSLVFGWVDLMVAFGGIAGLFLGCSLISAMELIYFVLVELPVFLCNEFLHKPKSQLIDNKEIVQQYQDKIPLKQPNWGWSNRILAAEHMEKNEASVYKNNLKNEVLKRWDGSARFLEK